MTADVIPLASANDTQRLAVFEAECLRVGGQLRDGGIERSAAVDKLHKYATDQGLRSIVGFDDIQHMIDMGLAGRESLGPALTRSAGARKVEAFDYMDFLCREIPPRKMLLEPWLSEKAIVMVHGWRGTGKTFFVHASAWAVAAGSGWLTWKAPEPRRVLLLDGEMPVDALQDRLRRVVNNSEKQPPLPQSLRIAAADITPDGLPDLSDIAAQKFYAEVVADADLVVVDNLSTLCRGLKENDADSWTPVQNWALSLRRAGKSVLLVHHDGKSGSQRGTSRKEDVVDTVIGLRKPPDYSPEQGARFEVHFEKSRGFHGEKAKPFEARLVNDQWAISDIKAGDDSDTIRSLHEGGLSVRQIAERTGLSKSTVARRLGVDE
jgi:AAA domain/Helix-turn-helix domain of resolvase